ncbi:hypothetical protein CRUP_022152 [Coryphaenoides rupestris]|nr:hypothetical protein CRUP_022152 [Coryphaenoides rupestris]
MDNSNTYLAAPTCTRKVEVSDFVRYHYNGTLLDGTLFDSRCVRDVYTHTRTHTHIHIYSMHALLTHTHAYTINHTCGVHIVTVYIRAVPPGQPPPWRSYGPPTVGIGWLIAGMDQGLLGMCVGERRIITMPPSLGYGENGDGSDIPGQASLVFDVVLLDLHNPRDGIAVTNQQVPEVYSRNHTYDTYVGKGYVIAGMDEGLLGVCMGERRSITIPPHLAYGEEGTGRHQDPARRVLVFDIHIIDFPHPSDTDGHDADEVPGSAVLVFDVELIDLEEGLPEGYMFIWNDNVSPDLFTEMDVDLNKEVEPSEFTDYIMRQVTEGRGRLAPGFDPYRIIDNMFSNQDRDGDGKITESEFRLKADEVPHDEL